MLTKAAMEKRVKLSKQLTNMFEKGALLPKKMVFSDEVNFYVGGFWGSENPHLTKACVYVPWK